jgi:hypothetical protein
MAHASPPVSAHSGRRSGCRPAGSRSLLPAVQHQYSREITGYQLFFASAPEKRGIFPVPDEKAALPPELSKKHLRMPDTEVFSFFVRETPLPRAFPGMQPFIRGRRAGRRFFSYRCTG